MFRRRLCSQHPAQALAVIKGQASNPPDALNFLLAKLVFPSPTT